MVNCEISWWGALVSAPRVARGRNSPASLIGRRQGFGDMILRIALSRGATAIAAPARLTRVLHPLTQHTPNRSINTHPTPSPHVAAAELHTEMMRVKQDWTLVCAALKQPCCTASTRDRRSMTALLSL